MSIFTGAGIGGFFILLGLFLIYSGLRRSQDRKRVIYSGIGSIVVGLGNLLMVEDAGIGAVLVIIGIVLIFAATRMRGS